MMIMLSAMEVMKMMSKIPAGLTDHWAVCDASRSSLSPGVVVGHTVRHLSPAVF